MKRFFPRIFFVIWLGAALTGAAVTLIDAFANPPTEVEERHNLVSEALRLEAIEVMKDSDIGAHPEERLRDFYERTGAAIYLFRDDGTVFGPKEPPETAAPLAARVRREGDVEERHHNGTLIGISLPNSRYVAVGRVRRTPAWARALGEDQPAIRIALLVFASALLAFLLAQYLVRPVRSLRRATRRIADGDLGARVSTELDRGVLAQLGADFDAMAERVEEVLESRQRLLSDVSHELNSPLARLRVALELARRKAGPEAEPALARMEREAERLGALVDEILTFTRLERAEVRREPVQLDALVRDVARDAAFESSVAETEVEVGALTEVELIGDPELLRRAVDNVVRNALRFTAAGTSVTIEMTREGGEARLSVRDHGPGVPPKDREAIFEPLYRVESDRGRAAGGGAGLGLAIAKRAVELHGGRIVADEAQGGGLEVRLTLPLSA